MFAGRYLENGIVVDDAGNPVPSTDPYYYNALADEARQRQAQLDAANAELLRKQKANAAAWGAQQPLPYPDAGFPPGYVNPFGGYVPGTEPDGGQQTSGQPRNPADALALFTGGAPWLWVGAGLLVLYMVTARRGR